jgi:hypothetical protein
VWVFQVRTTVPVAATLVFAVIWVISRVQFDGLANRSFPDALAPVTDPAQPLTLAPMTEMIGRTTAVLPSDGSPVDKIAVPRSAWHVVPLAAPADEALMTPSGANIATARHTRRNRRTLRPPSALHPGAQPNPTHRRYPHPSEPATWWVNSPSRARTVRGLQIEVDATIGPMVNAAMSSTNAMVAWCVAVFLTASVVLLVMLRRRDPRPPVAARRRRRA